MKMLKCLTLLLCLICFDNSLNAQQRIISECTIEYYVEILSAPDSSASEVFKNAQFIVYIKGKQARTDFITSFYKHTIITDEKNKKVTLLQELGNQKFLRYYSLQNWEEKNTLSDNKSFQNLSETKTIIGYECVKAEMVLKDDSKFALYYVPNLTPSVKIFQYQLKEVPGLTLEFEISEPETKVRLKLTAKKISLSPVLLSKFDYDEKAYRILD